MLTDFIQNITPIFWPGYQGHVLRGCFSLSSYQDELYKAADILLPNDLQHAVAKRKAEYLAGRYLAKLALEHFGYIGVDVPRGSDRAPQWPAGISGSLSHSVDIALCALHQGVAGVGIDVEKLILPAQAEELWGAIINKNEYSLLNKSQYSFAHLLTLAFSAKESLFKTLYPKVKRYFDFLDAQVIVIDWQRQSFILELLTKLVPSYSAGQQFTGHFSFDTSSVTTFIYLDSIL